MKLKAGLLAASFVLTSFLAGCGGQTANGTETGEVKNDKLQIYTTIFPLQDFAAKIGGSQVAVETIFPPGADAHTFEPTPKMMVNLANADAFIYSGVGLESFVEKARDTLKSGDVKLIEAAQGIQLASRAHEEEAHENESAEGDEMHTEANHEEENETESGVHDEQSHGNQDPHVWLDPVLAVTLAENIKNELVKLKPEAKKEFEANFNTLKQKLEELNADFTKVVESAPKKEILVAHAAYGYWEERYDIKQLSIAGLSPANEPSQKELQTIIQAANEHNIKYVIFEQNIKTKISDLVQKELGADSLTLHNLEALTEEEVKNNEDYFSLMKKNLQTLKTALQ